LIEQAMIFALGFLVAALFGLLFLPAVQRRAARLAGRRLEMLLPLSMEEIVAERDQLRAEFAVERRRIEQKLEAAGDAQAQHMGEIGRQDPDRLRALFVAHRDETEHAEVSGKSGLLRHGLSPDATMARSQPNLQLAVRLQAPRALQRENVRRVGYHLRAAYRGHNLVLAREGDRRTHS